MSIAGGTMDESIEGKVKEVIEQAKITKTSGCLLHSLAKSDSELARTEIRAELKEFRTTFGAKQEDKLLFGPLWTKASALLKGST
eukprot:6492309-Amphidinium_carterae.5